MARACGPEPEPGIAGAFGFEKLTSGSREIGPFRVTVDHVNHPVETFGFRVTHGGWSLAYSADTGECDALVELARDADLLLCEASFLEGPGLPAGLHLTALRAARHASRAGAGQLVLTHLVPWNDRERSLEEASGGFTGPVTLAVSGMSFDRLPPSVTGNVHRARGIQVLVERACGTPARWRGQAALRRGVSGCR
jgi:ribonuclease BN (tRNA processing enzyme)